MNRRDLLLRSGQAAGGAILAAIARSSPAVYAQQRTGMKDKHRVIVTTDIGWDPDDQQSLVHFLLYGDVLDIEGIVASPNDGNHGLIHLIHEIIDAYEHDYPKLRRHSPDYPTPAYLRSVTKQGKLTPGGPFLNGDFKRGRKYWRAGYDPRSSRSFSIETIDGKKALCFVGDGNPKDVWSNWFDVTPGNSYAVSIAARIQDPTRGSLQAQLRFYGDLMANETGRVDLMADVRETGGQWQRETVSATAPRGSLKARVFLRNKRLAAPARGYFADIDVVGEVVALPNEGADLIVQAANNDDPRPLWVLHWGASTDLAAALQKDPSIGGKIKTYSVAPYWAGTNGDEPMCDYIKHNHPEVLWILCESSFFGMFSGSYVANGYDNRSFWENHIKGHGALGDIYPLCGKQKVMQEGDTPSFLYLLHGDPYDPEGEHWGGSFVSHGEHADMSPNFYQDDPAPESAERVWGVTRYGAKTVNKWRKDFLDDFKDRMDRCL